MIALIERSRCWLVPMRPVTPFMMMPTLWVVIGIKRGANAERGKTGGNWSVRGRKAYPNARLAVRTIPTPPSTYPPPRHPLAMLAWSPLLVQKIEIHALGFVLRKLQLNRHRDAEVASHRHPYHQLILYLAGEGVQVLRDKRVDARA